MLPGYQAGPGQTVRVTLALAASYYYGNEGLGCQA